MAGCGCGASCMKVCLNALNMFCRPKKYKALRNSSESLHYDIGSRRNHLSEDQGPLPASQQAGLPYSRIPPTSWDEYFILAFDINVIEKNGVFTLQYGSRCPLYSTFPKRTKVSKTKKVNLMIQLDTRNWQLVAEKMGATNKQIEFLETCQERSRDSPTMHLLNVFELTNLPVSWLRNIFIDLERDDLVQVLDN